MKRNIILLGVLVLVAIASLAFLNPQPEAKVTVGVLVPLSGKSAGIGERVKAGIEAGIAEIEAQGTYDFDVVFEDDKGDATTAISAAQKLMESDGVRIIIGTVKSDALLAVAPITEAKSIILLSPTAGAENITSAGDFVFRVIETPDIHGKAASEYLGPGKKIALFTANAANSQSYGKFFKLGAQNIGSTIVSETSYNQDDTDFRTSISKAVGAGADTFYLAVATAKDAGILTRQTRDAGFTGTIMASVAADAKEFFDAAGPAAEGTVITASYFDKETPAGQAFNARYKALTGNDGDGFSANGYDAVMLIADALKSCGGDTNPACIRDFLYATKNYQGAGGTLSFDRNGDVTKPVSTKVARGGVFVVED